MAASYDIVIFALVFSFSVLAVLANLMVMVVIARTSHLRIKYYAFVYNLILADLGFAVMGSIYPWNYMNSTIEDLLQIFSTVNALTVLAVAINRYLAMSLTPPSRYDALVTPVRLFVACLLMWCFAIGITIPQMFTADINSYNVFHAVVRSLLIIIIWLITALVYVVVFRKIKRYKPPLADSAPIDPSSEQSHSTRYRQTRRLLVTFSIITAASLVCWIPANVNILILYFKQDILRVMPGFRVYYGVALFVYSLNTLVDPLIYWWRLDDFREALCAVVCCCRRKSRSSEVETGVDNEVTIKDTAL
ncbi:melanocortin receptor 5-like [Patiria miniata]|uniref:G-protein coupled receptors family 1 profile domain-containing protein n=1 Tax=Patiria miniata TaxID=46514 RepID=A0A913ZTW3_PATMI|nr:melanocortin receptor 5-like [Patiria miniata]